MPHALRFATSLTVGLSMVVGLASPASATVLGRAGSKVPPPTKSVPATAQTASTKNAPTLLTSKEFLALSLDNQARYLKLLRGWMTDIEEIQNRMSAIEAKETKAKKSARGFSLLPRKVASVLDAVTAFAPAAEAYQAGEQCIFGGYFSEWVSVKSKIGDKVTTRLLCSSSKADRSGDLATGSCQQGYSRCPAIPYGFAKPDSTQGVCAKTLPNLSANCDEVNTNLQAVAQSLLKHDKFKDKFDELTAELKNYKAKLDALQLPANDQAYQLDARDRALTRTKELIEQVALLKKADDEARKPKPDPAPAPQPPQKNGEPKVVICTTPPPPGGCPPAPPVPPPAPQPLPDKELLGSALSCVYHGLAAKFPNDPPSEKFLALLGIAAQQYDGPFNLKDPASLAEYRKAVIKMVQVYGYCSEQEYKTSDETNETKADIRNWLTNEGNARRDDIYLERALGRTTEGKGYMGRNQFLSIFGLTPNKRIPLISQSDVEHIFRPVDKATWEKMSLAEKQQTWYNGTRDLKTQLPPAGSSKKSYEEWIACRQAARQRMDNQHEFMLQYTETGLAFDDPKEFYDSKGRQNARIIPEHVTRMQVDEKGRPTNLAPVEEKAQKILVASQDLCNQMANQCGFDTSGAGEKNFCAIELGKGIGLKKSNMDGVREGPSGEQTERIWWRGTR